MFSKKSMLLFITLMILLIGVVNATEMTDDLDSNAQDNAVNSVDEQSIDDDISTVENKLNNKVSSVNDKDLKDNVSKLYTKSSLKGEGNDVSAKKTRVDLDMSEPDLVGYFSLSVDLSYLEYYGDYFDYSRFPRDQEENTNITVYLNGKEYETAPVSEYVSGKYIQTDKKGENNILVVYKGNETYLPSNNTITFYGNYLKHSNVHVYVSEISPGIGENVEVEFQIKDDDGNPIKKTLFDYSIEYPGVFSQIINGSAITDDEGIYRLNTSCDFPSLGWIFAHHEDQGYIGYAGGEVPDFYVGRDLKSTSISLFDLEDIKVNDVINISGRLIAYYYEDDVYHEVNLSNAQVLIDITNHESYNLTTNDEGIFSLMYHPKRAGIYYINCRYSGNETYYFSYDDDSFEVGKAAEIMVESLETHGFGGVSYGDDIILTGNITVEDGKLLVNTPIKIHNYEDENITTIKTNSTGQFFYNHTHTFSVMELVFEGNEEYEPCTNTVYLYIVDIPTKIILDEINDVNYGENVTIKGTLTDVENRPLQGYKVNIKIDDKEIITWTNNQGVFNYQTIASKIGTNNVSVIYNEIYDYKESETNSTFNVNKKSSLLTLGSTTNIPVGGNV